MSPKMSSCWCLVLSWKGLATESAPKAHVADPMKAVEMKAIRRDLADFSTSQERPCTEARDIRLPVLGFTLNVHKLCVTLRLGHT